MFTAQLGFLKKRAMRHLDLRLVCFIGKKEFERKVADLGEGQEEAQTGEGRSPPRFAS